MNEKLELNSQIDKESGFFEYKNYFVFAEINKVYHDNFNLETEFLILNINVEIRTIEKFPTFKNGKYNLLMFKQPENTQNLEYFKKLCTLYAYKKGFDFRSFFESLIDIFSPKKNEKTRNLIGLFGELFFIEYFYEKFNVNIGKYWHEKSYDKYDFFINDFPFEIKSTISKSEQVYINNHDQIFENKNTKLGVIYGQKSNSGVSIKNIIDKINKIDIFSNDFDFQLKLSNELVKINNDELETFKIDVKRISIFNCNSIPTLTNIPSNIQNISYEYNFNQVSSIDENSIFEEFGF